MPLKRRNMLLQCLWFVLTLSFYSFYWFYVTSKEMSEYEKSPGERKDEVLLWTVLMLIPLVQSYAMYKQGELYEIFSRKGVDRWVIFLLWIFFPPAVWFIIQRKINELAGSVSPASSASASGAAGA